MRNITRTKERRSPRHLRPLLALWCCLAAWAAQAEAPKHTPQVYALDPAVLAAVKSRLAARDVSLRPALDALVRDAEKALKLAPASVMDKTEPLPGGDKHDYVSYAPYFWPNPDKKDGLPYVRHDGRRNRDQVAKGDAPRFEKMIGAVGTLALAYELTGREEFAAHAAKLLRVWFLDPATKMNPNFTHAQVVLGHNVGRGTGLIEFSGMPHLVDAVGLLQSSRSWTRQDGERMREWLTTYARWLAESKEAAAERDAANNHGTWFDVQEVSLLLYLGKNREARDICERARQKRIARQIEPSGRQPLEEARADGFAYSAFNLNALTMLATLAQRVDVDLWHYRTPDGRSIRRALGYLAPYTDPEKQWPHRQLNPLKRSALLPALARAVAIYGDEAFGPALRRLPADEVAKDRVRLMVGK